MLSTRIPSSQYREDIDGLRAVAILSVVGFHAFPDAMPGGFIGVDIFFVISGYLISSIILKGLEHSNFSIVGFYIRRIRRIFPALLVVMITCYVLGWHFLFADEYRELGKHIAGGAAFASNLVSWSETGYFNSPAQVKPLLNLWSLGIEEQFYLIWPLVLVGAWKNRNQILSILIFLGAISFAIGLVTADNSSAVFFSPLSRFWELLMGAGLAYVKLDDGESFKRWEKQYGNASSLCGGLLIAAALGVISGETRSPVWEIVLPTAGAALIIAGGSQSWLNKAILTRPAMVWVGLISYPLYLWHWPLLVYARILEGGASPPKGVVISIVLLSVALSWITFVVVERPLRFGRSGRRKALALVVTMVAVGLAGYVTYSRDGFGQRKIITMTGELVSANNVKIGPDLNQECPVNRSLHPDFLKYCSLHINPRGKVRVIVWGDSHVRYWRSVFQKIATEHNLELYVISHGGCPPLKGVRRPDGVNLICKSVDGTANIMHAIIELEPQFLFMASSWGLYSESHIVGSEWQPSHALLTEDPRSKQATNESSRIALEHGIVNSIAELRGAGIDPIIIGSPPVLKGDPRRKPIVELQITAAEHQVINALVTDIFRRIADLRVFEPASVLCKEVCSGNFNGRVIYRDDNHLNDFGAMVFEKDLLKILGIGSERSAHLPWRSGSPETAPIYAGRIAR